MARIKASVRCGLCIVDEREVFEAVSSEGVSEIRERAAKSAFEMSNTTSKSHWKLARANSMRNNSCGERREASLKEE